MDQKASIPEKKAATASVNHNTVITVSLNLLMLCYAMSLTMLGPLLAGIIGQYRLQLSQAGLISTFQSIGGVIFTIFGGIMADHAKKSRLIGITFLVYSISLLAIAFAPGYAATLALFFVVGASTRMLDVLLNAYTSDINPDKRGYHLNLLGISFSIGGLLGPIFSSALRNAGVRWNYIFMMLGSVCIMITIAYAFIIKGINIAENTSRSQKGTNYASLISSPKLLVLCMIMFIFSGYQSGISIWMPMYMEKALFAEPFLSGLAVSLFYIGVILGRLLYSLAFREEQAKSIIMLGSLSGAIVLVFGLMVNNAALLAAASGLSGFLTCAVLPLVITYACNFYPESSGAVSSIILLNSVLSWMVFPWLIGVIADNLSFQAGMMITGISVMLTFLLAWTLPSPKRPPDTNSPELMK